MEGHQDINYIISECLQSAAPDTCTILATRAALRTLPLLMHFSATAQSPPFPVEAFGYWPQSARKRHLLALMRAQCLSVLLSHEKLMPYQIVAGMNSFYAKIEKELGDAQMDSEETCELAKKQSRLFDSSVQGEAFQASNILVYRAIESSGASLASLKKKLGYLTCVAASAEQLANTAAEVSNSYSEAATAARKFAAAQRFNPKPSAAIHAAIANATDAVMADANHLSKRFTWFAQLAVEVAAAFDQPLTLVNFVGAANSAAEVFRSLVREAQTANLKAFSAAVAVASAAVDGYEAARIAILPFYTEMNCDLFVEMDRKKYASLEFVLSGDFVTPLIANVAAHAEAVANAFAEVAEGSRDSEGASSAFSSFRLAYEELQPHLANAATIFDAALETSPNAFNNFTEYQCALEALIERGAECFDYDVYDCATLSLSAAAAACKAEVAAYANYSNREIKQAFKQSLLADVEFLRESSPGELLAQPIWLSPREISDSDTADERQLVLEGKAVWQELWGLFKGEAMALDADLEAWLDCYDGLFAGKPLDLDCLLLLFGYPPATYIGEMTRESAAAAAVVL